VDDKYSIWIGGIVFVILFSILEMYIFKGFDIRVLIIIYGNVLLVIAFLFWMAFGLLFPPPITTTVSFVVVFALLFLMFKIINVHYIFGYGTEFNKNILDFIGMIFTGFILTITLFWALMSGKMRVGSRSVYWQSYLLIGLFFYIIIVFYYVLVYF